MWISHSNFNTISGNIANETSRGISLDSSADNNFSGNIVAFNSVSGFYECRACRRNLIFNNYANNSLNADINTVDTTWNIEKTPGTNIVGGPFLGGNFWAKPRGNGFSQTATDRDKDGIADSAYTGDLQNVTDYLPLVSVSNPEKPIPILPVANFSTNVTGGYAPLSVQFTDLSKNAISWRWDFEKVLPFVDFSANPMSGYAPLSVQFTDLSKNATSRNWDFGDGTNSTEQNPMHTYSAPGTYTVNLTVSNANDSTSKLSTINVLQPSVYAYITNMGSNSVSVIDTSTNTVTATINAGHYPLGVVIAPDGTKAYVANAEGTVSIIDTSINNVIGTVEVGGYPYGIAISPDGKKVYVACDEGSNNGYIYVIDTSTNTVTAAVPVGDTHLGVAVTPNGTKVYVTNYFSDNISIIDTATNNVIGTVNIGDFPVAVAVNPDGKNVYVANTNYPLEGGGRFTGTVSVIDTTTNNVTAVVEVGASPSGIAVNPTGTKVYVANYVSNNISVINTATNNVTASVNLGIRPYGVAVSPDGSKVYVTNQGSNNVSVIDTATNNVIDTVNVGNSPVAFGQFIGEKSVAPVSNFSGNIMQVVPELTEADNGRRVNFKYGEIFYLILREKPGTSYALQLKLSNGLTILSEKSVLINPPAYFEVPGGVMGVDHIWKIKANSEGNKQIKGTYIQPLTRNVAETYTVYLKIGDGGSSGGRGGGGSGGGSTEPARNVDVKELSQVRVVSGNPVKFDFPKNATCVVYVSFDAKKTAGKTTTIAEQLKAKSTLTSNLSSGEVYKYFNLWVGNAGFATEKNIENPVVCFKVEKSWLEDKNIDQNSITLNRYSDKKWSELPIKLLREDSKYLYFTADTPGFTYFAITGKPVENEAGIEMKPETSTAELDQNITTSEIEQSQKPEQGNLTGSHESKEGNLTSMPEFKTLYAIICLFIAYAGRKRKN